ncbi:MAG TPA: 50S ribosomal protein L4, partial [Parachlamydiaceae bacterium]|nr:50S ribosomal protein L4 [Parachlamydiaceae bacterium]
KFDQHVKINRKERKAAIRFLISEKIKGNQLFILDSTEVKEPKTKTVAAFMEKTGLAGIVLFLGEGQYAEVKTEDVVKRISVQNSKHGNFIKSMRNIPKAEFSLATNISGYDVMRAKNIVMTEAAFEELNGWLS